jgi:hypothetical protein
MKDKLLIPLFHVYFDISQLILALRGVLFVTCSLHSKTKQLFRLCAHDFQNTTLQHFISPRCNPTCEQIKLPDRLNSSQARLFPPLIRFRIRLSQQQESDVQFKTRGAQLFCAFSQQQQQQHPLYTTQTHAETNFHAAQHSRRGADAICWERRGCTQSALHIRSGEMAKCFRSKYIALLRENYEFIARLFSRNNFNARMRASDTGM